MERGGFHGYPKLPKSSSAMKIPDLEAPLPTQYAAFDDNPDRESVCTVREQDRFMPIANVIRIMRKVLPTHAKISDDAKETIQECVSEYISFITSEANDRCQREQRKTITAEDVLWAMNKLGFDDYIEPLSSYLARYREIEGDHRGSIRGEPLPKRPFEVPPLAAAAYVPVCTMVHPHGQFCNGACYYRDEAAVNGSPNGNGAGMPGYDPYANYK